MSRLQQLRVEFKPSLPEVLQNLGAIGFEKGKKTTSIDNQKEIQKRFCHTYGRPIVKAKSSNPRSSIPLKVGVVLSGGQAAGGHNVISGIFDAIKTLNSESELYGFLKGPSGIVECNILELTDEKIAPYRNQGGFDLIGSGRTKIETEEQLKASLKTAEDLELNGIVVIGGDDSNTNAAILAEYFIEKGCQTAVVGVPKTIDGDLKNDFIETSFGFDTAAKTYSEMIGNIARDAVSAKKYTHFIKLMGRSASHIALECAIATQPNITLIGEEVARDKLTLKQITSKITDIVEKRAKEGKNYGVILVPEGLIEFIPEMNLLIEELNHLTSNKKGVTDLSEKGKKTYMSLPEEIQRQLLFDRDPHGNVQVSMIETEKLLINTVKTELKLRGFKGEFSPQSHFFGYEGRAGLPSNFDSQYCYALGHTAALLINEGLTGYMACVGNLTLPVFKWNVMGLPITMLMNLETRKGKEKPVIKKALVDLEGKPFSFFIKNRDSWALKDEYHYPGPIQFFGDSELVNSIPMTMRF